MGVAKKKEIIPELSKKDTRDLIMLCQYAKQIINKYDDPGIVTGLWLAFCTDLVTPEGCKVNDICSTEVKAAFIEYLLKVEGEINEGSTI